jgi:hypothetical protein
MSDRPATQARLLRTEREAAAIVGCSQNTLKGHVRSGALRHVAIGNGVVKNHEKKATVASEQQRLSSSTSLSPDCGKGEQPNGTGRVGRYCEQRASRLATTISRLETNQYE